MSKPTIPSRAATERDALIRRYGVTAGVANVVIPMPNVLAGEPIAVKCYGGTPETLWVAPPGWTRIEHGDGWATFWRVKDGTEPNRMTLTRSDLRHSADVIGATVGAIT